MTTAFRATTEQEAALAAVRTGGSVRITALAGTGKTSTLEYVASHMLDKKILYIAFNKAIQVDAAARFPRNVTCRTAHSLAYQQFGRPLQRRLNNAPRISQQQAARILGQRAPIEVAPGVGEVPPIVVQPAQIASLAMQTVRRFMRSADDTISIRHAPIPDGLEHAAGLPGLRARLVQLAAAAWEDLTDPNGALRCEHDVYLKLWAMSQPVLRAYDMIMVEAQDTDPLLAQVIARQSHAQIIVVGDENQSIYGWRGATDFLTQFPAERSVSLTRSFRFGPAVADEANVWLAHLRAALRVAGDPSKRSAVRSIDAPDAILCRTNAGALSAVIAQIERRRRVALVGGASDLERFVGAAQDVQHGRPTTHSDLLAFGSWSEVKAYAQTEEGTDLAVWVRLIERHTCDGLLSAIRTTVDEARAEVVVSTAHKAKGRQWPTVCIWNDFPEPRIDKATGLREPLERDEMMLAYVAVTRAQERLDNDGLAWIHDVEYEAQPASPGPTVVPVAPAPRPVPLVGRHVAVPGPLPEPVRDTAAAIAL